MIFTLGPFPAIPLLTTILFACLFPTEGTQCRRWPPDNKRRFNWPNSTLHAFGPAHTISLRHETGVLTSIFTGVHLMYVSASTSLLPLLSDIGQESFRTSGRVGSLRNAKSAFHCWTIPGNGTMDSMRPDL